MDVDLLVKDAVIITVNEGNEVFRGSIAIADGLIVDVARGGGGGYTAGEVVDGRGMVAMPGLINTHVHSYQAFLRGYPDDLPFVEWCNNVLFPFYEAVHYYQSLGDYSIGYHASLLSAVEMVKSGVTCAVSQDTLNPELPKAFLRVGMRVVYAVTLADRWLPKSCLKESAPRELVRGAEDVIKRWHGYSNNMVRCMLAPSAPFTCSEELLREVAKSSTLNNVGISMHINETRYEVRWALKELGMPVVKYLDSLGILSSRFLAVHCVWCSDEELEVIRVRGAHVSHNPESNMKLASGIAPIPKMLRMGINVSLGTDGAASNDNLDMIETMRIAAMLHKVATSRPNALTATDVVRMATINGARALGLEGELGSIEVGKRADIVLLRMSGARTQPLHDPVRAVVYCSSSADVDTVVVDGRVVVRKGSPTRVREAEVVEEAVKVFNDKVKSFKAKRAPLKDMV